MKWPALGVRTRVWLMSLTLLVIAGASIGSRLPEIGSDFGFMIPELVYNVTVTQSFAGHGEAVSLQTFLPQSDDRQTVVLGAKRVHEVPGGTIGIDHLLDL